MADIKHTTFLATKVKETNPVIDKDVHKDSSPSTTPVPTAPDVAHDSNSRNIRREAAERKRTLIKCGIGLLALVVFTTLVGLLLYYVVIK